MSAVPGTAAVDTVERVYRDAGIDRYAAWVHESDAPTIARLTRRGYRFDSSTRVMAMSLDAIPVPEPGIELGEASWEECLRILDLPDRLLTGVDPGVFHVLVARLDGRDVGTTLAYDHDGDCGIYNVVTIPQARRRGIGAALTALQLHHARERGCATASLQSTAIAERVYASLGFRGLGR
jgi:GNAT superfamily N-acetyltransferase